MSVFHEEVQLQDFDWDEENLVYTYPCPCGDIFEISLVCVLHVYIVRFFERISCLICYVGAHKGSIFDNHMPSTHCLHNAHRRARIAHMRTQR